MAIKPVEILIKARDEASGVFGALQGKLAGIGVAIAGYFGISAFAGAVRGAADLEAKLSEVKAVSGASAEEMKLLRKAAEDAGATTKYTATEGADALGNLTRAGLSAKDAIAALPATLSLAQAGGIGLGEASEFITKAVMGMGLAFSDASRVADVLAAGANGSNTSVTGLAQALSYTAPVANSLGLSLETTVAIIGKFADAGIDASRAGTALNAILSQFSDPASKFRQELGTAGITTNDFEKALHQLAAAGSTGERAILAVGTEAGPALRALLNQGMGALDELKGKLDNAGGSAAAVAAVMQDNLRGATDGLASAWDTVKNALATPVLPVLKDGVTQLSAALSSAVSSGTVGRFGEAIATAFQGGIKWAREFAAQVDFGALATRLQAFATQTQEVFTQIGEYARNAGNIVQTVYGVMSAGTNTVLVVIYKLGEAFSGVASNIQSGLALLYEGLSKITFGAVSAAYKQAADSIRESAGATWAASEAFAKKANEAFNRAAEGAVMAQNGWVGLTDSMRAADPQAAASAQAMQTVAETLKEVGGDAMAAGQKAQAAAILHREAAESTRAAVAELKQEYEAALAAGNVQLALEKLQAMQGALQATSGQAKLTGQDIENAFTRMGVTSSAELAKLRDAALRDYEIIKNAGTSTARDKAEAFRAYAEKAIAANNGVATETLKTEAAMRGLEVVSDGTGKAIVRAMSEASGATHGVGDAARHAAGGFDGMRVSAEQAAAAIKALDEINTRYGQGEADRKGKYDRPSSDPTRTSDGFQTNKDGSAKGTFTNTLPLDQAYRLLDASKSGRAIDMTQAEYDAAVKQAKNAYADMQALMKLNPGSASADYISGITALMAATKTGRVNITDRPSTTANAASAGTTRTVEVRLRTDRGSEAIPTTDEGAEALVRALKLARLSS